MTEDIEQEIPCANEADSKGIAVFRFGSGAIRAPAFNPEGD